MGNSKKQTSTIGAIQELLHGLGTTDKGVECRLNREAYEGLLSLVHSLFGTNAMQTVARHGNRTHPGDSAHMAFDEETCNEFCAALGIEPGAD